ncbi:MAG: flavodoxin family protein [Chloroflexi bacterium]|nr:flavodoxin family protein [Chloroflexota bacterium]
MNIRILAVAGSPRRGGNSETLLDQAIAGAESQGALVEKVVLQGLKIAPCIECDRCFQTGRCAVQDDYQVLYDKLLAYEGVILAAPIFFMNVSAQAKAFIDRCQCLWAMKYVLRQPLPPTSSGLSRRAAFIATAGSPRTKFDCALSTVRAFTNTLDATYNGDVLINGIDEKGAVSAYPDVLRRAFALGEKLALAGLNPDEVPLKPR